MKKLFILGVVVMLSSCAGEPKEVYPYNISEKEWNELSVKDKTTIRRDFYFYEKGSFNFVNPHLEVEGKAILEPVFKDKKIDSSESTKQ